MTRVVIVARTRMHHDHVCIGGHTLDRKPWATFRPLRLLDRYGDHWRSDSPFEVGDLWEISYEVKGSARPPHVEDVFVMEHEWAGRQEDLRALILKHARPWTGDPEHLFDRTVRPTPNGNAHIPKGGRIPKCSTGYWHPSHNLTRLPDGTSRFAWTGDGPIKRLKWVGAQSPPERIDAGSLVRVSLSRLYKSESTPEGYYVQLSGVL